MKALPNFRRALTYVWPQKRLLSLMVLAVLGGSLFYTASISSVLPLLHVMFSQNQTLPDYMYKTSVEHRLQVQMRGAAKSSIGLEHVVSDGPMAQAGVQALDVITAVNGKKGTQTELMRWIAELPNSQPAQFSINRPAADSVNETQKLDQKLEVTATPKKAKWYSPAMLKAAELLPQGHDPDSQFRTLVMVISGLLIAVVLGGICDFCLEYIVAMINERALVRLRSDVFGHVIRLPMSWFAQQQAGDTLSRFARDTSIIEVAFKILFEKMLSEPLKASGVFAFALWLNWQLMVLVLLVLPGAGWVIYVLGNRIKKAQRRASRAWGQVLDLLDEKIVGIKILKSSCATDRERHQFFKRARLILVQQLKISRADASIGPTLEILGALAVSGFILWGGWHVLHGGNAAEFFTAVVCLGAMLTPIRRIATVNNRIQGAEAAAGRIFEVVDLPVEQEVPGGVELPALRREIELCDVSFTYPSADRPAVCRANLKVKAGETIAVVGPNGSGKTTLSSLLLRFFEPTSGKILLDGQDIQKATLRSLRRQIGLVTQDTVIFTDTIRNNIAYANPKASDEEVHAAAKAAHADDFILNVRSEVKGKELAGYQAASARTRSGIQNEREELVGYDAIVSSRTLSGGQKQRIAIARAILNNPAILIFDEATSQVDADSEKKIQEALAELTRGRTTFIIAHRLSTVINANRIAVMDKGRIVAVGTHQELLKTCEYYTRFCSAQGQG